MQERASTHRYPIDEQGYLLDPEAWDEAFAEAAARDEGVTLGEEHWEVIRFMRAFLDEHGIAPDARFVIKHLKETRGADRNRLFELFPFGYVQQACRIAGMKRPRAWSTG